MLKARTIAALPALALPALMASAGVLWVFLVQHWGVFGAAGLTSVAIAAGIVLPLAAVQAPRKIRVLAGLLTWWHGVWLMLFVSALVFRARDLTTIRQTPVNAWALYRIVLVSLAGLALAARLALRRPNWLPSLFRGLLGALAVYGMVSLASTLWSVYPAWTFYKALEYLVDLAVIAAVLAAAPSTESYKSFMDWTWFIFGGLLVTVWLGALVWPERAFLESGGQFSPRLTGVFPVLDQNSVGDLAAVLALVALARLASGGRIRPGRAFYSAALFALLITLVFSQTRGAIVGFLLAMILVLLFSKRLATLALLSALVLLLASFGVTGKLLQGYWQRGDRPEDLQAYSGRLTLWQLAWEKMQDRPVLGFGAYAGGRFGALRKVEDTSLSSALNAYVEIALGTGLLGLVPVVVALAGTWRVLFRAASQFSFCLSERALAVEAVGVLTVITVRSFFTVQFVWHPSLDFLAVLGYAELLRRSPAASSEV